MFFCLEGCQDSHEILLRTTLVSFNPRHRTSPPPTGIMRCPSTEDLRLWIFNEQKIKIASMRKVSEFNTVEMEYERRTKMQ